MRDGANFLDNQNKKKVWSHAGKGLIAWLSFVMFNCVFVTFQCGILSQVWYLIELIPDLCHLSNFVGF